MTLIDGKKVADEIKQEIAATVEKMVAEGKKRPHPGCHTCRTRWR